MSGGRRVDTLRRSSVRTGRDGTFLLAVRRLPKRALVIASGGRVFGRPFRGRLRASLRNHAAGTTIYVNPASTLVAAYLAAFPKRTPARATTAVKRFLVIPSSTTLTADLQSSSTLFSGTTFLRQARGKVDRFLVRLVAQLRRGQRHSFRGTALPRGAGGEFAIWFGKQLANGAVSYLGGLAMGWVFSQFGVEDGIAGQIAQISAQLEEINRRLTELGTQVQQIIVQSDKQYLVTVAKDLDNARSDIKSRMSDLLWVADMGQQDPKPDPAYLEQQSCAKLKALRSLAEGTTGYGYAEVKINGSFFPEGTGSESISQAAAWVVRDRYRWWTKASAAEVRSLVSYWIALQSTWLNLKLEWEHSVAPCPSTPPPSPGNCEALRWAATYLSDTGAEADSQPPDEPRGTWIDRSSGLMWAPNYVYSGYVHPPPASMFNTFFLTAIEAEIYPLPSNCTSYEYTICAIEGVGRSGEQYGGFRDWVAPTEPQVSDLIDGWRTGGFSTPTAFLSADAPAYAGASAPWIALGNHQIWTQTCRNGSDYTECVRYDLKDGSQPVHLHTDPGPPCPGSDRRFPLGPPAIQRHHLLDGASRPRADPLRRGRRIRCRRRLHRVPDAMPDARPCARPGQAWGHDPARRRVVRRRCHRQQVGDDLRPRRQPDERLRWRARRSCRFRGDGPDPGREYPRWPGHGGGNRRRDREHRIGDLDRQQRDRQPGV